MAPALRMPVAVSSRGAVREKRGDAGASGWFRTSLTMRCAEPVRAAITLPCWRTWRTGSVHWTATF